MFKLILGLGLILIFSSCEEDNKSPSPCPNGDCAASFEFGEYIDGNGYTHVSLNWSGDYLPYFWIKTWASPTSLVYRYNERSFVTVTFESDTFWEIGDNLVYRVDYYNPFQSDRTSRGKELPIKSEDITLDFFKGVIVNVAKDNELYYAPTSNPAELYTKKSIGPFPPQMQGDTLTIYGKVFWDALPMLITKIYELPVILE